MAHGIEQCGVGLVDEPVVVGVLDVVVGVVGGLAIGLEVVPEQPVVDRVGLEEVGAPQQGELLLERIGDGVLEGEEGGWQRCGVVGRLRHDPVLGIGERLAAEQLIQERQPRGGEQDGLVGAGGVVVVGRQILRPLEHGLVELDEPDVLDGVLVGVEGDGPVVGGARRLEQAAVGRRRRTAERGRVPGLVQVDLVEHPLHPPHHELRQEPSAAVGLQLGGIRRTCPLVGCRGTRGPVGVRVHR